MLTGRRLFERRLDSRDLAGVLKTDIDFSSLPPTTPAATRRLLERCLERDPKRRLRDIGEARIALSAAPGDGQRRPSPRPRRRERESGSPSRWPLLLCAALGGAIVRSRNPAVTRIPFAPSPAAAGGRGVHG